MAALDFLTPFYQQHHTRESLVREIDAVLAGREVAARALPFYCQSPAADWLEQSTVFRRSVSRRASGGGIHEFACDFPNARDGAGTEMREHRFFIYDHPEYANVYVLLTLEPRPFFEWLRERVERSHPALVTTFITHRTLRRLLESFQSRHGFSRLVIKRASLRIRIGEENGGGQRRPMPAVAWPELELDKAFDWVYEQNGWFQSLQFEACRDHRPVVSVSLTHQGITRTDRLFSQVFAGFVDPVCERIHKNVGLFGQRSRRERADLSARPLLIDFEGQEIAEDDQRLRFVQAMRRLPNASVSVLHGNPYVHLSVLDYYDGSVFDVWVLSGSEITIVPQMKGTIPAIKRLVKHVFDSYGEGRIRDCRGGQP